MGMKRCPNCDECRVLPCILHSAQAQAVALLPRAGAGFWETGVPMTSTLDCCLSCGHVWATLRSEQVGALIRTFRTGIGKDFVDTLLKGPYHDLPDHPAAREAADKVAEIDSLIMSQKDSEANRRYRELTGKTWDESIAEVRRWAQHDRATKLALFGWRPKEKVDEKGQEVPAHPMRDPWLDE